MKSKAAQRAWGIFVHVILIALSFVVPVFLLYPDRQCYPLSC